MRGPLIAQDVKGACVLSVSDRVTLLVDQPDDEVEQDGEDDAYKDHADQRDVTAKTAIRAGVANIARQAAKLVEERHFARQPDQAA